MVTVRHQFAVPLLALFLLLLTVGNTQAQLVYPSTEPIPWKAVGSENFEVYYPEGFGAEAKICARYAELARFEVGRLLDFSPEKKYFIFLVNSPAQAARMGEAGQLAQKESGRFVMPALEIQVVHPGTRSGLYKEVRR
ncbi:MAG: hypothetical protein AAGI38_05060, partial [Bacteroidota bacterium]